ncbi:MAG: hypothetical protein PWQ70_2445 [Clostridiales bacterium]|nr:hypothetical protein [Clostridiales bacterium]
MANKEQKSLIKNERIEDMTQYGEFISSFHQWTTSERQRANARHLEEIAEMNEPNNVERRGFEQLAEQDEQKEPKYIKRELKNINKK